MPLSTILRNFTCLLIACLLLSACSPSEEKSKQTNTLPPLNICYGATFGMLFMAAEDQDYFQQENLPVSLTLNTIGRANVMALNNGSCDIALSAETPVVRNSFLRDDFKILGTIAQSRSLNRIITFRDSGINSGADFKNRRIATAKNTSFHFFLDVMLSKNGMTDADIQLIPMKGSELIPALEQKTVDAIITTDMHALRLKERLGDAITIIGEPGLNLNYGYLLVDKGVIEQQPDSISKLLKALLKAQEYNRQSPEMTKSLFRKKTGLSQESVETIWSDRGYELSFDHVMLATLEDHARWMLKKGAVKAKATPHFLDIIQVEPLQTLSPKAVKLMR